MLVLFYSHRTVPDPASGYRVGSVRSRQLLAFWFLLRCSRLELRKPSSIEKRPFRRGSCRPFSTFPVSADDNGLSGGFLASGLCIQKFRSRRLNFGTELTSRRGNSVCVDACVEHRPDVIWRSS